jgi:hypothetical protein
MGDVTDEDAAAPAAGTHADTCPRCRTPATVAEYTGPGGPGRLLCCLTCGRVLSVETHAAGARRATLEMELPGAGGEQGSRRGQPA